MPENPLDLLKAGLSELKQGVEIHRKHLLDCLQQQEKISEEDEAWLDNHTNYEEAVILLITLPQSRDLWIHSNI